MIWDGTYIDFSTPMKRMCVWMQMYVCASDKFKMDMISQQGPIN